VVDAGVRLTVGAQATVRMSPRSSLYVLGELVVPEPAPGTPRVRFTPRDPAATDGYWESIHALDGGVLRIAGAEIDRAVRGLTVRHGGEIYLRGSLVRRPLHAAIRLGPNEVSFFDPQPPERIVGVISTNRLEGRGQGAGASGSGIDLKLVAPPEAAALEISGNTLALASSGISLWDSLALIRGNIFENNGSGVFLRGEFRARPIIDDNEFRNNSTGITLISGADALITNNTIVENTLRRVGISILDSSPEIAGNMIRNASAAIDVRGSARPLLRDNTLTENEIGLRLTPAGSPAVNPAPIVNGNAIFANDLTGELRNVALQALLASSTVLDFRGNFFDAETADEIDATIVELSGATVPIDVSGFLASPGGVAAPGSEVAVIGRIAAAGATPSVIEPRQGGSTVIRFSLAEPASRVVLRIHTLDGALPVRELALGARPSGTFEQGWDGRDASGRLVPSGGYRYVIEADFPSGTLVLDPGKPAVFDASPDIGACLGCATVGGESNTICPFSNERLPLPIDYFGRTAYAYEVVAGPSTAADDSIFLTRAEADACLAAGECVAVRGGPVMRPGGETVFFDGRRPDGTLFKGLFAFGFFAKGTARSNFIIVEDTEPQISGLIPPPTVDANLPVIQVPSAPFRIKLSYDQLTRFTYRIDQDAIVTVKLLRPGPPTSAPEFVTLLPAQLQSARTPGGDPIDHTVEFNVFPTPDSGNDLVLPEVGDYTFSIEARSSTQPDLVTTYLGVVNIQR
jgi:parallel beta-helix repeat protein